MNAETYGYPYCTFEMLHDFFRTKVKSSAVTPIQVQGGFAMMGCNKDILSGVSTGQQGHGAIFLINFSFYLQVFEDLIKEGVFVLAASSSGVSKDFGRYRCTLSREHVLLATDRYGQSSLKKWLTLGSNQ
jgi:origin recognition complex subunit 4